MGNSRDPSHSDARLQPYASARALGMGCAPSHGMETAVDLAPTEESPAKPDPAKPDPRWDVVGFHGAPKLASVRGFVSATSVN